jgi:uncharacterized membrane protein YcaP (DUF421 family)
MVSVLHRMGAARRLRRAGIHGSARAPSGQRQSPGGICSPWWCGTRQLDKGPVMSWLIGHWNDAWMVCLKTVLLYGTALAGLRLGTRRTLAQMSLFDFVTAVAMGAVVGRTATASTTSYAEGGVALLTLIVIHRLVSVLRLHPAVRRLTDHRIRILVDQGRIRRRQLYICGLTEADLSSVLRQRGVTQLADVRLVLYEPTGSLTVLRDGRDGELIRTAVDAAVGQ